MAISFVETMSGAVRDEEGKEHPISFDVSASGRGAGHFELKGIINAPPWAPETSVEGTLTMSVLRPSIAYHLDFTARDGRRLSLDAEKTPSVFKPVTSMTFMPALLKDSGGRVVARGEMRFDLKDLVHFLASWLPGTRTQQRQLDVRRRAVDRHQLEGG